jgi:hypothetical protein
MTVSQAILGLVAVYAALGLVFAVAFVSLGVGRVDPAARDAPVGFRVIIVPASAALWPWLLVKWGRS